MADDRIDWRNRLTTVTNLKRRVSFHFDLLKASQYFCSKVLEMDGADQLDRLCEKIGTA